MDAAGDIEKVASTRRGDIGSMSRRGRGDDVFSRSSREDDGDEVLRWAALEKLPTCDRVRRAILPLGLGGDGAEAGAGAGGGNGVVDVDVLSLGPQQRRALLERLVRVPDDDNFMLKLKDRVPTIELRFQNLGAEAEVRVGCSGLPTVLNSIVNTVEEGANALHLLPKRTMPILHDVSGINNHRRVTLLLGPPGSGKTTLLLPLAGRLDKDLKVTGKVTYNGHEMTEFVRERTAAYISQHDLHIKEMTVREILAFSARCQGVGSRFDMLTELSRGEKAANIKPDADVDAFMKASAMGGQEGNVFTDYILKLLGPEICTGTMEGDEMLRGISGVQQKRVTTGEMLVGPARALFMDGISTGLDSSTVNSLRQSIHILGGTAVVSLLQPAPETYNLFDDIILLSDGQVVYQGPREEVLEFFESMGFRCLERKGVADFLQEVTSKNDQKLYWARRDEPYRFVPVKEFLTGRAIANELAVPFDKSKSHPAALTTMWCGVSGKELLKANIDREIFLMKRNSFVYMFRTFHLMLMSIIAMTLFFHMKMKHDTVTDGGLYMGALFFGVLMIMCNCFYELALTVFKLPVFLKQRDLLFFPAWSYNIPSWILKIPITFIEVGCYVFLTYYVIGFDPNVGRFFKQYLLLLAVNQMAAILFRYIGWAARNMIVSNVFALFMLLVVMVLGGIILARVNEILGHSWDKTLKGSASNETLGVQVLKSLGVFIEAKWYWIGFGAMAGFTVLFNALFTLALTYLKSYGNSRPSISEKELKEKHANIKGEVLDGKHLVSTSSHQSMGINTENDSEIVEDNSAPKHEIMFNKRVRSTPYWIFVWITFIICASFLTKVDAFDDTCPKRDISYHVLPRRDCPAFHIEKNHWLHEKRVLQEKQRTRIHLNDILNIKCKHILDTLLLFGCIINWPTVWQFNPSISVRFLLYNRKLINIWIDYGVFNVIYYASWAMYGHFLSSEHGKHMSSINFVGCILSLLLLCLIMGRHRRHLNARYVFCRLLVLGSAVLFLSLLWSIKSYEALEFIGCVATVVVYTHKWATVLTYKKLPTLINICAIPVLLWCIDFGQLWKPYGISYIVSLSYRAIEVIKSFYLRSRRG